MDRARLEAALSKVAPPEIASEIVSQFLQIRDDTATKTLGRASPGKFVETFVQLLQHRAHGSYDPVPKVDDYLHKQVENETTLPEGLRICAARVARSIYTLRNKRNIAHKNEIDPNTFDLTFVHHATSWIMAELFRNATALSMQEAGSLIAAVQTPVADLVEEIEGVRLVHANVGIKTELMILLHSHYPDRVQTNAIKRSLAQRNHRTMGNFLRDFVRDKLAYGDAKNGYRLTQAWHHLAGDQIRNLLAPNSL